MKVPLTRSKPFLSRNTLKLFADSAFISLLLKKAFYSFLKSDPHLPKRFCLIYLIESPLEIMKNSFYFILKALFVLKIFKFLSQLFGHVGKTA